MRPAEFHYWVPWRTDSAHPGSHPGRRSGAGLLFQRHAAFIDHPDPRRLDLRASLLDPRQAYQVRVYEQRGQINVFALADLSASMGYQGEGVKMQALADFVEALAASAHRAGDPAGLLACSELPKPVVCLPATRQHGAVHAAAGRLRRVRPQGANVRGLLQAARFLPVRRSLVFLLSDFHYPMSLFKQIMASLSAHDVVPVALWDLEERAPHEGGLARLRDMENGRERLLWLRPELRARLQVSFRERRRKLAAVARGFGREPLFLEGGFDPEAVTRYFAGCL